MNVIAELCDLESVRHLRFLFRKEVNCQIVRDSILERGLADPYCVLVDDHLAGYGGVWNSHFPDRVMEYYVHPDLRFAAVVGFGRLLDASNATHIEAQSNIPLGFSMLRLFAADEVEENVLFGDGPDTTLSVPNAQFRRRQSGDEGPEGDWVVEREGDIVGAGGILTHYNPPFGDIYMAVAEQARGQGIGSFLVQELRRECASLGLTPAARCDPSNHASRRALTRGGLRECGRIVSGRVKNRVRGDNRPSDGSGR